MGLGRSSIVVVTPHFPVPEEPYRGQSVYQTARQLAAMANVEVLCPIAKYPPSRWLQPRSYQYYPAPHRGVATDIKAVFFEYPAFPYLSRWMNARTCKRRLLPLLRDLRPDLVLAYWLHPEGFAAASAARELGIPCVVVGLGSDIRRVQGRWKKSQVRRVLRESAYLITVSAELRQRAIELGAAWEKTVPVLSGCDPSIFYPRKRSQTRRELGLAVEGQMILFVGRLSRTKGIEELLESFARLAATQPALHLTLSGEGRMRRAVEVFGRRTGLSERIQLTGPGSSHQVAQWINAADVLCLPSYSEGCPNVVIEALACGRPVVTTNEGGMRELVNANSGLLVPSRDVRALTQALACALGKSWDPAVIQSQFRRSWADTARETLAICDEALKEHKSSSRRVRPSEAISAQTAACSSIAASR